MDDVGEDDAPIRHHRDGCLIAAGLDGQREARWVPVNAPHPTLPPDGWRDYCPSRVIRSLRRPRTSESIRSKFVSYARRKRGEWIESDHITIASSPLSV